MLVVSAKRFCAVVVVHVRIFLYNSPSSSSFWFLVVVSSSTESWALVFIYVNRQLRTDGRSIFDSGLALAPSEVPTSL